VRLLEHEGKQLLAEAGIAIPQAALVTDQQEAAEAATRFGGQAVLKAQTLSGRRGKRGLVRRANSPTVAAELFAEISARSAADSERIYGVVAEMPVQFHRELYVSITVDDRIGAPVVLASESGGQDIERAAETVVRVIGAASARLAASDAVAVARVLQIPEPGLSEFVRTLTRLYAFFWEKDAVLAEINPLFETVAYEYIAGDAKIEIDDDALFRHPELAAQFDTTRELSDAARLARDAGIRFVELPGTVAVLSLGAGISLALLDLLHDYGLEPANFCDTGGGVGADAVRLFAETVVRHANASPRIEAIVLQLLVTATPLENVIDGLVAGLESEPTTKPIVGSIYAAGASVENLSRSDAEARLRQAGVELHGDVRAAVAALAAIHSEISAPAR
jgi:succinyl-CoA synthetase beta subunit